RIALGAGPRRDRIGAGALEVGRGLRLLGGIDAGIDLVERLALPNDRAFLEKPLLHHARNLRPNLRDLEGSDTAGKFLLKRSAALLPDDETDRGRTAGPAATAASAGSARSARSALGASAAAGEQHGCRQHHYPRAS